MHFATFFNFDGEYIFRYSASIDKANLSIYNIQLLIYQNFKNHFKQGFFINNNSYYIRIATLIHRTVQKKSNSQKCALFLGAHNSVQVQ